MEKRIVYQNEEGGVSIVVPSPFCELTVEEIAKKDVPTGIPYWIVDASTIPSDRSQRNLWIVDIETAGNPSGYGE